MLKKFYKFTTLNPKARTLKALNPKSPKRLNPAKKNRQEQASRELFVGAELGEPWLSVQRPGFFFPALGSV